MVQRKSRSDQELFRRELQCSGDCEFSKESWLWWRSRALELLPLKEQQKGERWRVKHEGWMVKGLVGNIHNLEKFSFQDTWPFKLHPSPLHIALHYSSFTLHHSSLTIHHSSLKAEVIKNSSEESYKAQEMVNSPRRACCVGDQEHWNCCPQKNNRKMNGEAWILHPSLFILHPSPFILHHSSFILEGIWLRVKHEGWIVKGLVW